MTFIEKRVRPVKVMQAVLKEYEHPASGARHIHLATDDPEMVFLVAFPTVPDKDDGRAHIARLAATPGSDRWHFAAGQGAHRAANGGRFAA